LRIQLKPQSFYHPRASAPTQWNPCLPVPPLKTVLVAMAFSTDTASRSANIVRKLLLQSCDASPGLCRSVKLSHEFSHTHYAPSDALIGLYRSAKYCIIPSGGLFAPPPCRPLTNNRHVHLEAILRRDWVVLHSRASFIRGRARVVRALVLTALTALAWDRLKLYAFAPAMEDWLLHLPPLPRPFNLSATVAHLKQRDLANSFESVAARDLGPRVASLLYAPSPLEHRCLTKHRC